MKDDKSLREDIVSLLTKGNAHASFDDAIKDLPANLRGKRPAGLPHSPWELLEHLRIAQWDIIEYALNPKHESPEWPSGYWPPSPEPPDTKAWDHSLNQFRKDLNKIVGKIKDPKTNLLAPIKHAKNQSLHNKALLLADHNSYHVGQLILVRRLLGAWKDA